MAANIEALCATCPLRGSNRDYAQAVESCRARADDEDDRMAVLALAEGDILLSALSESRPTRCQTLDEHLPEKRRRHAHRRPDHVLVSSCAEMALAQAIAPSEFPDDFDIEAP